LFAFARAFEFQAMDDALDLLDLMMTELARDSQKAGQKERLRTLKDLSNVPEVLSTFGVDSSSQIIRMKRSIE
jgi:hypothetical protein